MYIIPPTISLDFETVPDIELIKLEYPEQYLGVSDKDIVSDIKAKHGSGFLPIIYHKLVSIGMTFISVDKNFKMVFTVTSIEGVDEKTMIQNLNAVLMSKLMLDLKPILIGWNSKGFDIPVWNYRSLKYGLSCPILHFKEGDYKWNNYTNRYHERHVDLMDVLGNFSGRGNAKLDAVALLCGLPGKFSFDREQLYEEWVDGNQDEIDTYCKIDTLSVLIMYLRWMVVTNAISLSDNNAIESKIREELRKSKISDILKFEKLWKPLAT